LVQHITGGAVCRGIARHQCPIAGKRMAITPIDGSKTVIVRTLTANSRGIYEKKGLFWKGYQMPVARGQDSQNRHYEEFLLAPGLFELQQIFAL
jgi:hypothetical protein